MKWIDGTDLGEFTVEKVEGPRPGGEPYIFLAQPKCLIVHTTEGSTIDGAVATLKSKFFAPHFVVGQDRIVQMRPLDAQAATVHDWNSLGWQVECVGFSKLSVHQLSPTTWRPLVEVSRFMHDHLDVPLKRPEGWHDDLSDIKDTPASNNTRRQSRIALGFRGFLGHLDIPDQDPTWHWDPGALDYTALFAELTQGDEDVRLENYYEGFDKCAEKVKAAPGVDPGPPPETMTDPDRRKGWSHARFGANNPKTSA